MNLLIQLKQPTLVFLIAFLLACLAIPQSTQAVVPAPDGGYPGLNTAEGQSALFGLTTGQGNTAVGWVSLRGLATGNFNTGVGAGTLLLNNAENNTAVGTAALLFNTTGEGNTATGAFALYSNTEGQFNTANGEFALYFNTMGERNTAIGNSALYRNTEGSRNTAIGNPALLSNTTGADNTAVGAFALFANNGDRNVAIGSQSLSSNTTGLFNTAVGHAALDNNTTGGANTAIGAEALNQNTTGAGNAAVGLGALANNSTGSVNTALGFGAGDGVFTASNVISIGAHVSGVNVENSCFIGNIWQQSGGSQAVYVNFDGKLGAQVSARRFKEEIKPIKEASVVIYDLKPVSFRYKPEIDPARPLGFGLIAEDVEKTSPDLVTRNREGQVISVRYDAVNAMLLNEFLKEHRKVQELTKDFQATVAQLTARLDEQASQIQKVSAQLEASKPAPQVAENNQ